MKNFNSLLPAFRDRLFLCLVLLGFLLPLANQLPGQFKFRDPVNRQDPEALEDIDGQLLWNRFMESRSIGSFSIEGILEYRPPRMASSWMDFELEGTWLQGSETTRLVLSENKDVIVEKIIVEQPGLTTIRESSMNCDEVVEPDSGFYTSRVHESLPLTWSDILMPFLKWNAPSYVGPTRYLGRPAHRFELRNPDPDSFPGKVVVTIDEDFAALLKADLYDASGKAVRRMRVGGFKQFDDAWMFSELTWENRRARESIRLRVQGFSAGY